MSHRALLSAAAAAASLLVCGAVNAAPIGHAAGPVQQVLTAGDVEQQITQASCSTGFVNIPGASIKIKVPSGGNQLLTARFNGTVATGQSSVGTATADVRIVMGTRVFGPNDANNPLSVASSSTPTDRPAMLERTLLAPPGAHNVAVQWCVQSSNSDITAAAWVYYWNLTVEAAPVQ